jgi:tyrosine-protein phosphatase YwqE
MSQETDKVDFLTRLLNDNYHYRFDEITSYSSGDIQEEIKELNRDTKQSATAIKNLFGIEIIIDDFIKNNY